MDADHGFPSRVKSDRLGMLLSDRHGCYYVIGMNVIERSPCVGICSLDGWLFDTITDFSYQGYGDWAELDKELDFDFLSPEFTHIYLGVLEHDDAIELYQLWENNFWLYCQMNTFSTALGCT